MNAVPAGPLAGIRVVEFGGIGPGPHACMLLSDMGAEIVTIIRPGAPLPDPTDATTRGRAAMIELNLKASADIDAARALIERGDVLIEAYRPGVMERLGLGPNEVLSWNPRLVYARMTGWGQAGPLSQAAGHDINYISLCGALAAIGPANGKPTPPLNLIGDYGGGSLYLTVGILAALLERARSGQGQVIDAAICDGVTSLMALPYWLMQQEVNAPREERGSNIADGGRVFYNAYECSDGKYVSVGAVEPQFYRAFCEGLGLENDADFVRQIQGWEGSHEQIAKAEAVFRTATQQEWLERFADKDACVTPVLWQSEAASHPHNVARETFVELAGVLQPAPAPRFSRTPSAKPALSPDRPITVSQALDLWRD